MAAATTPVLAPAPGVTRRERKVYAMLVEDGLSRRQIAQRLGISPETAKTHIVHILAKYGVASCQLNSARGAGGRGG